MSARTNFVVCIRWAWVAWTASDRNLLKWENNSSHSSRGNISFYLFNQQYGQRDCINNFQISAPRHQRNNNKWISSSLMTWCNIIPMILVSICAVVSLIMLESEVSKQKMILRDQKSTHREVWPWSSLPRCSELCTTSPAARGGSCRWYSLICFK